MVWVARRPDGPPREPTFSCPGPSQSPKARTNSCHAFFPKAVGAREESPTIVDCRGGFYTRTGLQHEGKALGRFEVDAVASVHLGVPYIVIEEDEWPKERSDDLFFVLNRRSVIPDLSHEKLWRVRVLVWLVLSWRLVHHHIEVLLQPEGRDFPIQERIFLSSLWAAGD